MAYQSLGLGSAADDGTGDSLRIGGDKINDNFVEIYTAFGSGTALTTGITATGSVATLTSPIIATSINHADNVKAYYGTGNDLSIYHDGSNSYINDQGTGNITFMANQMNFVNAAGSETLMQVNQDGAVLLLHDNSQKLTTDSSGIDITGQLDLSSHLDMPDGAYIKLGTGDDLNLYHDGTNSYIANSQGALKIATETSGIAVTIGHSTSEVTIGDNLNVNGDIDMPDGQNIKLGTSDDFQIYHDGSNSYIDDIATGELILRGDGTMQIKKYSADETMASFAADGAVTLYYDNAVKFATTSSGISVTGAIVATGTVTATPTAILLIKDSGGSTLKTINGIASA